MGSKLSVYLDEIIFIVLLAVAGVTPLLFTNLTTDFFETPKLIFLAAATIVLYGLWTFSWVLKGKISINRTPLDGPLLALLAVVLTSTFFSLSRYPAIYGNMTRMHGTAISWVIYVLLFFVAVSNLRTLGRIRSLVYVLMGSGLVLALVSLLAFFRVYLPFGLAQSVNFTPAGSTFSVTAMLLMLLPLPLMAVVKPNKYIPLPLALVAASLFGVVIALIGTVAGYVVLGITVGLCVLAVGPAQALKKLPLLLVPVVLTGLTMAMALLPIPGNPIKQMEGNFPREIQLPFGISWKVTASAFRDAPFVGTGPATYGFNFTSYKPLEFNLLNFWNFTFDAAYNELLQVLGTLGILGLAGLLTICFVVLKSGWRNLSTEGSDSWLAVSVLVGVVLLAIHATTLVSWVVTLLLFAAYMMSQTAIREKIIDLSLGLKATTTDNKQFDLFPLFVFVLFVVAAVPVVFRAYNVAGADYYHRKALAQANTNGTLTYQSLQKAEAMNPYIDLYRVDLAQTNFALANAIAAQATGSAGLTDQQKQTIQTLLSQAITEGRVSVTLSPLSSKNWEVLGSIYRNMAGVAQNSLTFALDAYGKAIQRDPANPALRVNVGGIYYAANNYDMTIRFFTDAVNLKPDYVNAYYNLAVALRDKGDLANAKLIADQAVTILQKDPTTPDYKVATALAEDLKNKVAAKAAVPAAQTSSALGNPRLPDVNVPGLNTVPQVATPEAVQKNPEAVVPVTPTPTPVRP